MNHRSLTNVFTRLLLALAIAIAASITVRGQVPASDDSWPKFRGGNAGVVSDDPALPESWSTTENVAWKVGVPGSAWSSPIVWGDDVFVTTVISDAPRPTLDLNPESGLNPHTGGRMKAAAAVHSVSVGAVCHRFPHWSDSLGAGTAPGHPG